MSLGDHYKQLKQHYARLEAHKRELHEARGRVSEHAVKMHDATHDAVDGWTDAVEEGKAGILGQRRLRTLLTERSRLAAVTHAHEADLDERTDG